MKASLQDCKDLRWKKLRLKIFERDDWCCTNCGDSGVDLFVHFKIFIPDIKPWDYPEDSLVTLCESCLAEERKLLATALSLFCNAARKHFLSVEIDDIATSLDMIKLPDLPEVVASAISLWLRTPRLVEFMVKIYLRKLKYDEGK